ncbi:MAG: ribonuclease HII [Candidatus Woesearchaeota archaeon]
MNKFIAGIDEAGRGPLIGPLVIAVAAIVENKEEELRVLGVKDSKLLTERQREDILKELIKIIHYELVMIQPSEIDEALASPNTNLNWLEADHGAALLNKLNVKLEENISKCIIDCPSNNVKAFTAYVQEKVDDKDIKLQIEHKADLNYLIVGAASIIAKVTREKELEKIKKKLKIDFGSGYPSDPKTKEFVEKHHSDKEYSQLFRKSWETYRKISRDKAQKGLGEF